LVYSSALLAPVEQDAQATGGGGHQGSQRDLPTILGACAGSSQAAGKVRLYTGLTGAERALFSRLRSAHRATHRQDLS